MRKVSKIIIICVLITITLSTIVFLNKKEVNKSNGMFAIMLETSKGTGKYDYAKDNKWPKSDEYVINMYKTYCEKGSVLRWNNETKKINATVKGTDKCYVYFDLSEYGDEEHPYLIQTIEDLVRLSNDVKGGTTYEGKYFLLTTDLDFQDEADYEDAYRTDFKDINGINGNEPLIKELTTGSGFKPIGNSKTNSFQGIFDGNNNKIKNIFINNTINEIDIGLFGFGKNTTIKNLSVSGNINSQVTSDIGGIIGVMIAGINEITNCHNEVNITSQTGSWSSGGIIGSNHGTTTIKKSTNKGNITNGNNTGGLIGTNDGNLVIEDSVNYGIITNNLGANSGGLLGRDSANTDSTTINNSHNEGAVSSNAQTEMETSTGGLVAKINGKIDINNSYNTGEVRNERIDYTTNISVKLGGIIGYLTNKGEKSTITNSYNTGNLYGATKVGGIIGYIVTRTSETIIDKCYNKGNVTSNVLAGENNTTLCGMVGYVNGSSKAYILNSYNIGNITSAKLSAGIGFVDFGGILYAINTYNIGNLVANMVASGLFTSSTNNNPSIYGYNSYNIGKVEATRIGGIYAQQWNNNIQHMKTISNLYYENSVSASNVAGVEGSPMALNDMKQQTFVDELNKNIESINLEEIDSSLKNYTLSHWTLGSGGYPTLINE